MQRGSSLYPMTGVFWDLNTCPVPAGFDVGLVRPSIELALKRALGPRPVTIFAVGNLDNIPVNLLEKISSSGIPLRHASMGLSEVHELITLEWSTTVLGRSALLMLISSDPCWFSSSFDSLANTILRAYDGPGPNILYAPPFKVLGWESLFKECVKANWEVEFTKCAALEIKEWEECARKRFPAWQCFLCRRIPPSHTTKTLDVNAIQSFDDLIKHLKSEYHKNLYLDLVPSSEEEPCYFPYFCTLCQYPAFDTPTLDMHYSSEVHARKAALERNSEKDPREKDQHRSRKRSFEQEEN